MKKVFLLLSVAVLVLGLAFSAQADQTINFGNLDGSEPSLWEVVNGWFPGANLNQNDFQKAAVLQKLPAGTYAFSNFASYSAWSQRFGYATNVDPDLKYVAPNYQNQEAINPPVVFSGTDPIYFYDNANNDTLLRTTINQNINNNPPGQSSGFIFDLSQFNQNNIPFNFTNGGYFTFPKCYVVAFEDQLYGDSDYQDCIAQVCPTPIPGSLLLLGSGLVGLLGLRRKMVA